MHIRQQHDVVRPCGNVREKVMAVGGRLDVPAPAATETSLMEERRRSLASARRIPTLEPEGAAQLVSKSKESWGGHQDGATSGPLVLLHARHPALQGAEAASRLGVLLAHPQRIDNLRAAATSGVHEGKAALRLTVVRRQRVEGAIAVSIGEAVQARQGACGQGLHDHGEPSSPEHRFSENRLKGPHVALVPKLPQPKKS